MRTVEHCRVHALAIVAGCARCGRRDALDLGRLCRAFDGWAVEELERAGVIACEGCGLGAAAMVEGELLGGHVVQLEVWRGDRPGLLRRQGFMGGAG